MRNRIFKVLSLASAVAVAATVFWAGSIAVSAAEPKNFYDLQTLINDASNNDTITLTDNYQATTGQGALVINNKNITIDLNGYTIDRNLSEPTSNGYVIKVENNATLTIKDSSSSGNGIITGGSNNNGVWSCSSGILVLGTFNLEGGTIRDCKSSSSSSYGGAVSVEGGTFNMSGGCIDDCEAYGGGAVRVSYIENKPGTFNMTGGTITNCKALYGGAIITNNFNAYVNISGGEIRKNTAIAYGGCAYIYAISSCFEMTGGKISENCSECDGGGIFCCGSEFRMYGGEISNNTSRYDGGGLYFAEGSNVILGGTAKIKGNKNTEGSSDNVCIRNNVVTLGTDDKKPVEGFSIGISMSEANVFTANSINDDNNYFFSDSNKYFIRVTSDKKYELVKSENPDPDPDPDPNPEPDSEPKGRYYIEDLENQLNIAIQYGAGSDTTILWTAGDSLPQSVIDLILNSDVTVEFKFTYEGVDYDLFLNKNNVQNLNVPWYGPYVLAQFANNMAEGLEGDFYTVQDGDTMSIIAAKFGMSLEALTALNPQITDIDFIRVNQKIRVK